MQKPYSETTTIPSISLVKALDILTEVATRLWTVNAGAADRRHYKTI